MRVYRQDGAGFLVGMLLCFIFILAALALGGTSVQANGMLAMIWVIWTMLRLMATVLKICMIVR